MFALVVMPRVNVEGTYMVIQRRAFNSREKVALFLSSNGECSVCGVELSPGWHADHVHPWSRGGETDVRNGQALCPSCNIHKGDKMSSGKSSVRVFRRWQIEAFAAVREFRKKGGKNFLAVATPGAGKTTFALNVAAESIHSGESDLIVVVVPIENLKGYWADKADPFGMDFDPLFLNSNGTHARDYHGIVVTYAQVASSPLVFQRLVSKYKTFVMFDEMHHGSEQKSWGIASQQAFGHAIFRLLLSGTPFRSDNDPIPFVTYTEEGKSRADFTYGYEQALADKVCRPVIFPTFEGEMRWYYRGQIKSVQFKDDVSEDDASSRLKIFIDPSSESMKTLATSACEKLESLRLEQPDAAGLIVAKDVRSANAFGDLIFGITGERPVIVTCEDKNASSKIKEFKDSCTRWIIAVKMVSEGVDIPRLRVAVYATNIVTEMFFRQVVGRIVRVQEGREGDHAFFYFPADPRLKEFAASIMLEREHQLQEEIEEALREDADGDLDAGVAEDDKVASTFVPLGATGYAHDVIYNGEGVSVEEVSIARQYIEQFSISSLEPSILACILRQNASRTAGNSRQESGPVTEQTEGRKSSKPKTERKKSLRTDVIKRLVSTLANQSTDPDAYRKIYVRLAKIQGNLQDKLTEDQLRQRIQILERWIRGVNDGY